MSEKEVTPQSLAFELLFNEDTINDSYAQLFLLDDEHDIKELDNLYNYNEDDISQYRSITGTFQILINILMEMLTIFRLIETTQDDGSSKYPDIERITTCFRKIRYTVFVTNDNNINAYYCRGILKNETYSLLLRPKQKLVKNLTDLYAIIEYNGSNYKVWFDKIL